MPISQVPFAGISNPVNFRNRIINGDMGIDQRNAGASVTINTSNPTYTLDRWGASATQDAKFTVQQNAGSVTPPAGFTNYLGITSTATTSLAAGDFFSIGQRIEGFNIADLGWGTANAQTVTLSFWVRSSLTGTFGGAFVNDAYNRGYPFSYTISAANTWEYKTVTIAGDTTGTWITNNGLGLNVIFGLGVGTNNSGTAGAWAAAGEISATGATSVVGTNGAALYITGVQLEAGEQASGFEFMPIDVNLGRCQRYYYKTLPGTSGPWFGNGVANSTTEATGFVYFNQQMRSSPTALEQTGTAANYAVNSISAATACSSVPVFSSASPNGARVDFTVASGLTGGQGIGLRSAATTAYLAWSAEL